MGFVRWGRLAKEIHNYERDCVDFLLLSNRIHVLVVSYTTPIRCLEEDKGLVYDIFYSSLGIMKGKM